ncbi:hypothetical protein PUN28_019489 [Cardiocondyla obscurior]
MKEEPLFQMSGTNQDWLKFLEVNIDEPAIQKSIRQYTYSASTLKGENKITLLLKAIGFIDLTSLNHNDTSPVIENLCKNAVNPIHNLPFQWDKPLNTAAICVYPVKVKEVLANLKKMKKTEIIKVASVAGGFPSGQFPLETRLEEVRLAISYGAQEIDVVIDRTLVLNHDWIKLYEELAAIRAVCNENAEKTICLKVILSTGELSDLREVYQASMVALFAGANFIKTSTGKEKVNATLEVGIVMCKALKEFERLTLKKMGFKPAGGIKTAQDALQWLVLIQEEMGDSYLTNERFRIGASSLLQDIVAEIIKTYNEIHQVQGAKEEDNLKDDKQNEGTRR